LDGVKRIMRAGRDDRDLELIAHILDDVEEMPLFQEWTSEHVMDLVDNEHLDVDGHEHAQRLGLQILRPLITLSRPHSADLGDTDLTHST
jgi:hypothetical protein